MALEYPRITASYIGAMCGEFRRMFLDVSQQKVADDTGTSREAVSKFERGNRSNAVIFMWYIKHGLFNCVPIEKWNGWEDGWNTWDLSNYYIPSNPNVRSE